MKKIYAFLLCFSFCLIVHNASAQTVYEVSSVNYAFVPANFSANVGDTIRFRYTSGSNHTTTSARIPAGAAVWDSPLTPTALVYNYVVTTPGTYTYLCKPHASFGMTGSFVVSAVAPVKMTNVKASAIAANTIKLTWKTETEINADHFSIEVSNDGLNFTEVGKVAAAGNSIAELSYTYTITVPDANIGRQYVYLRIITVDKDSRQEYSDIVLYKLHATENNVSFMTGIYPNPAAAGDHLHFTFNADAAATMQVTILDVAGKALSTIPLQAVAGFNQTHMPLPSLKRGTYYLRFDLNGKKESHKIVVQ